MSLAESGGGFTIGQVAARVGVTPAAIRQRYGSRQKLIAAMARRRVEQTHARFDAARQLPVPRLEALETALVAELGLVETPRQLAHVFSAYTDLIADPAVAAIFGEEIRVMIDETRRLLGDARDAGEVDVEGSEPLARAVVAAAEGSMLIWALAPDGDLADRVREAIRLAIGSPG